MSYFRIASSTSAQRGWTMSWLAVEMGIPIRPFLANVIAKQFYDTFRILHRLCMNPSDRGAREMLTDKRFFHCRIYSAARSAKCPSYWGVYCSWAKCLRILAHVLFCEL
ncbi:hypothetical protein BGW36DRAFT_197798 [Talaromyces proteolyticus]|uniref:Uncharacterized protein n=1 Tax=Talaromyces proteolyticus TaxID=1131652 RepID=A0AAD4KMN0_9EURO|nr:uncharacterized protein BGW36DRAFT_197798 [Talaromyces proteolyticus]KAH8695122.1 hypothetical protein BGW36DRAFT_197798 [Talaromyces proteolyticus]